MVRKLFDFCVPLVEQLHSKMSITEISMALRSLDAFDLMNAEIVTTILLDQQENFKNALNLEIFSLLDIITEVNTTIFQ